MDIKYAPSNYEPQGPVTFRSWSDAAFKQAMRDLFQESPRETLVELVIDREGIRARFEPKK